MRMNLTIVFLLISIFSFAQNPIKFQADDKKFGFKNQAGQIVVSAIFDEAQDFENGLAIVNQSGKFGVINLKGDIVIPINYSNISNFKNGLTVVELDYKKGVLDTKGNVILPCKYELINIREKSILVVFDFFDNDWGLYNLEGKKIELPKYNHVDYLTNKFLIVATDVEKDFFNKKTGGKWYLLDESGEQFNKVAYDYITLSAGEIYKVCSGGKYHETDGFTDKVKGKCGFLDSTGKLIIPIIYEDAKHFSEELAAVKTNGKWGFIDRTGKLVIPATLNFVGDFWDERALVFNGKKYGFIDKSGKLVIPYEYDAADEFMMGEAYVTKNGKTIKINTEGKEIN